MYHECKAFLCYQKNKWKLLILSIVFDMDTLSDCLLPAHPPYGQVSMNMTDAAAIAMYSCELGYGIVGQASRQCGENQAWEGEAPECRGKSWHTDT